MKRSQVVELTLVSSLAAMLMGCREKPTRYCVDNNWNVANEVDCERNDSGHRWHYGGGHGYLPIGAHVNGGSTIVPAWGFSRPGPAAESGIFRGGIGHAGEAASGGHGGGGE